jgi:hypothetical protein
MEVENQETSTTVYKTSVIQADDDDDDNDNDPTTGEHKVFY